MKSGEQLEMMIEALSAATGLPIIKNESIPENFLGYAQYMDGTPAEKIPCSSHIIFGDENDNYEIIHSCVLEHNEYSRGSWNPDVKWEVRHNAKSLSKSGYSSMGAGSLDLSEFDANRVQEARYLTLRDSIGRMDVRLPAFMNYHHYTLESLSDDDSYFKNIYLTVMCHLKERGLVLPPIMSMDDNIRDCVENGDMKSVQKHIDVLMGSENRDGIRRHMEIESRFIVEYVQSVNDLRNPNIDIADKFSTLDYLEVDRVDKVEAKEGAIEKETLGPYNILAVENQSLAYGEFTDRIVTKLNSDGRFGGTKVFHEMNLDSCCHFCETGQIDMILFDWQYPTHGEAMMFPDSIYENNERSVVPAGCEPNFFEQLIAKSKTLDIRKRWMKIIKKDCEAANAKVPEYFIVRKSEELGMINDILYHALQQQ